jgi:hypothetical protein
VESLIDQIIEDRDNGLPVPNIGLSADLLAGYYVDGQTRVATEISSVYSVDAVFYPASGGSFDRVLNSVGLTRKEGGEKVEDKEKGAATPADAVPSFANFGCQVDLASLRCRAASKSRIPVATATFSDSTSVAMGMVTRPVARSRALGPAP